MAKESATGGAPKSVDTDQFRSAVGALRAVAASDRLPEGQVEFIELHLFANGEVAWRVRPARAEESVVGTVRPEE